MELHDSPFGVVMYMGMPQRPVSGREPSCPAHHVTFGHPCAQAPGPIGDAPIGE